MTNLSESVCRVCGQEEDLLRHDRYGEATRDCFDHDFDPIFVAAPAATEEPTMERATFVRRMPSPDDDYTQWRAPWGHIFDVHDSVVAAIRDEQAATIKRLQNALTKAREHDLDRHTCLEVDGFVAALADEGGSDARSD